MVKKLIRRKVIDIICEVVKNAENEALKCADEFVKTDKYYQNNPYRAPALGFIRGVKWLSNEITKKL